MTGWIETINPATEEHLTHIAWGEAEDIDRAVRAARRAFADDSPGRKMSASERGRLMFKISELIEDHADEFATLEALDNGKPVSVAKAADVALAADLFRYMAGWPTKIEVVFGRRWDSQEIANAVTRASAP